ncbi:MAG: response regulator transcription factor [Pseudomonadota bacterium]
MAKGPTVLIVDDHPLFRDALEAALVSAYPDGASVYHAGSLGDAQARLNETMVDLVLLDLNLSDTSGFDGLAKLRAKLPGVPIYVISATERSEAYATAKTLGASGYLPKSLSLEDLSAALATALDGGTWFPDIQASADDLAQAELAKRVASLTPAQKRVMAGLSDGLLNKQIAYEMDISIATVKAHMTAVLRKLGANNRTQALLIYTSATSLDDHSAA